MQNLDRVKAQKWLEDFHAASATLSATQWCNTFFTNDIILQFGNYPPVSGLSTMRDDFFAQQLARLDLMKHHVLYFDVVGPRIYQSAKIRYRVKGDSDDGENDVELPGFAVFDVRREGGVAGRLLCYNMEVYCDTRPLEARMAEVFGGSETKSA